MVVPKEAPPEYEFLADPPSISAFDLGKTVRKGNTVFPHYGKTVGKANMDYFPHYGKTVGKGNTVFSTLW